MKLDRRQFMKNVMAAGCVVVPLPAISNVVNGERKWFNEPCQGRGKKLNVGVPKWDGYEVFDPAECMCFRSHDRFRPRKMVALAVAEIIYRRVKESIPPPYRNKLLIYYRFKDYHMALSTLIIYRPDGDLATYAKKLQWIKENGWHRYYRHPGDHIIFHHKSPSITNMLFVDSEQFNELKDSKSWNIVS